VRVLLRRGVRERLRLLEDRRLEPDLDLDLERDSDPDLDRVRVLLVRERDVRAILKNV
jgi:hypothetical protein